MATLMPKSVPTARLRCSWCWMPTHGLGSEWVEMGGWLEVTWLCKFNCRWYMLINVPNWVEKIDPLRCFNSGEPGLSEPKSYYLNGKDQSLISRSNIVLEDATVDFINEQTIMEFTTTFESLGVESPLDTEPAGISLSGSSSFIWSHGKDGENEMKYHGSSRGVYEVIGLGTGESSESTAAKMTMSESISSYQSKWLAHGILAFIAWGICAPVAITSAIYRDFDKKLTKWWFYIHIGCNSLNYFFTFVVFCLAVSTIKKEGSLNWYHAHNKVYFNWNRLFFNMFVCINYSQPYFLCI